MNYQHPGPKSNPGTFGQNIKAMVKIMNPSVEVFPEVKMPRKRRVETKPRKKYDNPEARLRNEIIKYLRGKGCKVFRIETGVIHQLGLPDLLVFSHAYAPK
jgi:hypothetical protein